MQTLPKSRLLRFVEEAFQLAQRAIARYSSKFSKQRYTLHQHIVLLCLKIGRTRRIDRSLTNSLRCTVFGVQSISLNFLLRQCCAKRSIDSIWPSGGCFSISLCHCSRLTVLRGSTLRDSTAVMPQKHLTKQAKLTIQQLKVTLLVDTRVNAILDLHITTTRKHDTQITPSLINRNAAEVGVLLGDKGYDDQQIRAMTRENGIRPLIKHREFSSLQKAWNARLDTELYGQRSQSETVNSRLKRKYGAFVRLRRWWKQFRELAFVCIVHNLDRAL